MDQPSTPEAAHKVPQTSASTPQVMPQPHISQDNSPTPKSLTDDCQDDLTTDAMDRLFLQTHLQEATEWQSPTLRV